MLTAMKLIIAKLSLDQASWHYITFNLPNHISSRPAKCRMTNEKRLFGTFLGIKPEHTEMA